MTIFRDDEWLVAKVTDGCDGIKEEDIVEWLVRQNKILAFEKWLAQRGCDTFEDVLYQMTRHGEESYLKVRRDEYRRECAKELVAALYNPWPRFWSSVGIATVDPYGV